MQSYEIHSLLAPPRPSYSSLTLRRACVVTAHCGLQQRYTSVCDYYHHLEALEDKSTPRFRAMSRHHEIDLFENQPPASLFLHEHFPTLYPFPSKNTNFVKQMETLSEDKCIFTLEGFNEIRYQKGVSLKQILKTSDNIRKYSRHHRVTLRRFLQLFKRHVVICQLEETISTLRAYILTQMVKDELLLLENLKSFNFDDFEDFNEVKEPSTDKTEDETNMVLEVNTPERSFDASSPKSNFDQAFRVLGEIQNLSHKKNEDSNNNNSKRKRNGGILKNNNKGKDENRLEEYLNSSYEIFDDSFKSCNIGVSLKNDFFPQDSLDTHYDISQLSTDFFNLACK